jgi:hypothetical protein
MAVDVGVVDLDVRRAQRTNAQRPLNDYRPAATMRIETSAGVSATTSFCLIEAARG